MAQINYVISTTALSLTASGTTVTSGTTTSGTFVVARTIVRTALSANELLSGTQSWKIDYVVSAMTTPYEMYFVLQRRNSSGTVQSTSSAGTTRNTTGTYTDTISWDSGTWAANDQLALVWYHRRPSGSGNKSGTITANGSSYVTAPQTTTTTTSTSTSTTTTTTTTAPAGPVLVDSYPESNATGFNGIWNGRSGASQSFTATAGNIVQAAFYLIRSGSPTGNIYAELYNITGTYGTNSYPTGSALATSDAVDAATFTEGVVTFNFSGAQQYTMSAANYCIVCRYSGGDGSNFIFVAKDGDAPTHSGNAAIEFDPDWYPSDTEDLIFYVYKAASSSSYIKTINSLSKSNIKTINSTSIANTKTANELS